MFPPIPRVTIPIDHKLSVTCRNWCIWSKPNPKDGRYTAEMFIGLSWVAMAFTLVIIFTPEGVVQCLAILGVLDAVMRVWRIKSAIFFIPIWVWCLGLLLLLWFRR